MGWKLYDVTVQGYGTEVMTARSASAVRAAAWRSDAFRHISFGDFMGMCRVKARTEPLASDGYDYVRSHYGVNPQVGQRVRLPATCGGEPDREGAVVYPGQSTACIHVLVDGRNHSSLFHPSDVVFPTVPTPSAERTTP